MASRQSVRNLLSSPRKKLPLQSIEALPRKFLPSIATLRKRSSARMGKLLSLPMLDKLKSLPRESMVASFFRGYIRGIQMNWEDYKNSLITKAEKHKKKPEYISECLLYAEKLFSQNLPVIFDVKHFAMLVGYKVEYVYRMAFAQKKFYRHFTIEKRNGTERNIDEPLPDLKIIQRWILDEILFHIQISKYAKAFVKGASIKSGARFHRKQAVVLTVDIKDFFPSVHFFTVRDVFLNVGYSRRLSTFLANICTLNNSLPQGAPTSPYLSNIVMREIDETLGTLALEKKWRYTRYADDITFSGNLNVGFLMAYIEKVLRRKGFHLNSDKTRVARKNARQEVTGIVVNQHMQIAKQKRKDIRQQVYYIKKYGVESHLFATKETRKNYIPHLLGLIEHAIFINPEDKEMQECKEIIKSLCKSDYTE